MNQSNLPYYQAQKFTATLKNRDISYYSKPGIPHWNQISPAEQLIAENVELPIDASVLILNDGPSTLAVYLATTFPGNSISLMGTNWISQDLANRTIQNQKIENIAVSQDADLDSSQYGNFANALICLPKGRKLARRWLLQCWYGLCPRGSLYLAGANQEGIQPAVKDAVDLFGPGSILGYKKGNRILRFLKLPQTNPLPGWAQEAGIAPGTWHEIDVQIAERTFNLASLPGVFSYEQLDEGTTMLLSQLQIRPGERVVDVGCGYGPIGVAAALQGAEQIDLVDSNLLAVASANENIHRHQIKNTRAFSGDVLSWAQNQSYDLVVSNPPFHSGRDIDYQVAQAFIKDSYRVLLQGGRLVLVANRFLRYDRLMETTFGQVSVLAESGKYHVLQSKRGK